MRGFRGMRRPRFLSVYDKVTVLQYRGGAQTRKIGARIGFRIALTPDIAAIESPRKIVAPLLRRTELNEDGADQILGLVEDPRDATAFQFFSINDLFGE